MSNESTSACITNALNHRIMYSVRIFFNTLFTVFALVVLCENTVNPVDHRAVPNTFAVFEVAPYHNFAAITSFLDETVLVNGRVCSTCNGTGGFPNKAALLTKARADFDCSVSGFNPGVCEMCVDLWSPRLFDLANKATGVIDKASAEWKEMRANYESCFFKYSTWSVVEHFGGTNPHLHLVIWCGLMLVYSILSDSESVSRAQARRDSNKDSTTCCSTSMLTLAAALLVMAGIITVVLFTAFYHMTDPNELLPKTDLVLYDFLTTNLYQIILLFLYLVFFYSSKSSNAAINRLDGNVATFTNNNILFDIMVIAATPSMASIVCAYSGWLDYSMMLYLSQTITAVMSLVLASDVMVVFWDDANYKQHEDINAMHGQTHFFMTVISLLTILFVWQTDFINPRATDPFFGELQTALFFIFAVIMAISPSIFSVFQIKDPRGALNFKQGTELIYRVAVFSLIAHIHLIKNDP